MDNIIEEYGQLIVLVVIVLVGLLAYGGYIYYTKQKNIQDVNNNLKNNDYKQPSQDKQPVQGKQPILAFIPSNEFKGERRGYKFTQGPKGLGYYLDKK
jgi:flagellar basal body-associated protein FliL